MKLSLLESSFRDPSGNVFIKNKTLYRLINYFYKDDYELLVNSGLYKKLISLNLLVPHQEIKKNTGQIFKIIKPLEIPFISYPYEWCFSQLKDAALTTLRIQKIAVEHNMTLKDASAYNVQFLQGKPIFIDSLSFVKYKEGMPWSAYRQFCMHFLAPLILMSQKKLDLNKLLGIYIDGIPLDIASSLLSKKSWFNPSILTHIHIHSKMQAHFAGKKVTSHIKTFDKRKLVALIENLEGAVKGLNLKNTKSEWGDYYQNNNYTQKSLLQKKKIVKEILELIKPKSAWDIGSNTGEFSHLCSDLNINTVSFDSDPFSVETNYVFCKQRDIKNCLPLVLDITNPSPSIGWNNKERISFLERGPADVALALALVHHLAIASNIPLKKIAELFSKICSDLIIEFVPKEDSQVQKLLMNRDDIFPDYHKNGFESEFKKFFTIKKIIQVPDSLRHLYLMKKNL